MSIAKSNLVGVTRLDDVNSLQGALLLQFKLESLSRMYSSKIARIFRGLRTPLWEMHFILESQDTIMKFPLVSKPGWKTRQVLSRLNAGMKELCKSMLGRLGTAQLRNSSIVYKGISILSSKQTGLVSGFLTPTIILFSLFAFLL